MKAVSMEVLFIEINIYINLNRHKRECDFIVCPGVCAGADGVTKNLPLCRIYDFCA